MLIVVEPLCIGGSSKPIYSRLKMLTRITLSSTKS
jgi:hypothetical protein